MKKSTAKAFRKIKPKSGKRGPNMSEEIKRTIRRLYHDLGENVTEIAHQIGRHQSAVWKILFKAKRKSRPIGRPRVLNGAQIDNLIAKTKELKKKADGKRDITKKAVKRSARCKASVRTISRRFKDRKFAFKPYKEKILLTVEDMKARLAWAKKHRKKTPQMWKKALAAAIDNKWFQVYHNGKHRDWIARRSCRGVYRGPGDGKYESWMVKPKAELRYNTGKKAACIMGGIGNGKVFMWAENPAKKWSGKAACAMYENVLLKASRAPSTRSRRQRTEAVTGPRVVRCHSVVRRDVFRFPTARVVTSCQTGGQRFSHCYISTAARGGQPRTTPTPLVSDPV